MFIKGFSNREFKKKSEGIYGKVISGKNAQLTWIRLAPGTRTGHEHDNEQLGVILSGSLKVSIGNESQILVAGDAYCIPAKIRHGFEVVGDNEAEYIEIFSPPKQENAAL